MSGRIMVRADSAPTRRALGAAAAVIFASMALFALIAQDLDNGVGLTSRDEDVLTWFVEHRTDAWIRAARLLSAIGAIGSLAIIGALVGFWLWRHGSRPIWAIVPLVSLGLASLTSTVTKAIVDRSRPPAALHATTVTLAGSFPSGHATDAAAFFLATAFTLSLTVATRQWHQVMLVTAAAFVTALVGLSRLVLGVHWLSDVVAGWALGTSYAVAVVVAVWYLTTRVATTE